MTNRERLSGAPQAQWSDEEPKFKTSGSGHNTAEGGQGRGLGNGKPFAIFAAQLDEHPGRWARYPGRYKRNPQNSYNMAWAINTNRRPHTLPAERYEARVDEDNEVWVRAREEPR